MWKLSIFLLLLSACAHPVKPMAPSWVGGIRKGEERLKINHGSKTYYRRVAGGPEFSQQVSCDLVLLKAQEDLKKDFLSSTQIPYTVEVLYYDPHHKDCAVTLALGEDKTTVQADEKRKPASVTDRLSELLAKEDVSSDEAAEILVLRAEVATAYAYTGLSLFEFQKYSKEKVIKQSGDGLCSRFFRTDEFSLHGTVQVCWVNDHVRGYCTPKTGGCWLRSPD